MNTFLLLNSPIYREVYKNDEEYLPPLGLGYIATYLKKENISVELVDCVIEKMGVNEIVEMINNKRPEYVGVNIFTQNFSLVKDIVQNCNIRVTFFIGGQVVKFVYADIIAWDTNNPINIIIGEGEFIVPAIIKGPFNEVPIKQKGNKRVFKVDIDSAFFPEDISNISLDRTYFENRMIINHYNQPEAGIITSRGCIYNCAFCGGARSLNNKISIRTRTEDSIMNEITEISGKSPQIKSIRILDDLFLKNRESIIMAIKIFEQFQTLSWRAMAHISSFNQSTDLLEQLKSSGCNELFIGIESGSEKIRKKINKVGSIKQVKEVITSILRVGIDVKGYFIYGFPNETLEDFEKTFSLAYELKNISKITSVNFRTSVFQFRPYHGTQLYNEIIEKYGSIKGCLSNQEINIFAGRSQFNFQSGNYSDASQEQLNEFILKTQKISEEK